MTKTVAEPLQLKKQYIIRFSDNSSCTARVKRIEHDQYTLIDVADNTEFHIDQSEIDTGSVTANFVSLPQNQSASQTQMATISICSIYINHRGHESLFVFHASHKSEISLVQIKKQAAQTGLDFSDEEWNQLYTVGQTHNEEIFLTVFGPHAVQIKPSSTPPSV
ncbi:hypothetical protein ACQ4M3_07675 [Leptolyngbya sp. AN03gr2]|uniref:hypothetical protein n=1 Tax=unclassified Leptolyngbya TaxID=2650499 RepID=UPI003D30F2F9